MNPYLKVLRVHTGLKVEEVVGVAEGVDGVVEQHLLPHRLHPHRGDSRSQLHVPRVFPCHTKHHNQLFKQAEVRTGVWRQSANAPPNVPGKVDLTSFMPHLSFPATSNHFEKTDLPSCLPYRKFWPCYISPSKLSSSSHVLTAGFTKERKRP